MRPCRCWCSVRAHLVRSQTAALAALLTGLFSFNTVYASTQSSDAVCTCLFMAAIVAFDAARRREASAWFALVGLLLASRRSFDRT